MNAYILENSQTPPPQTTPMLSPRFARDLDARKQYEDRNVPDQNEPGEKTEETLNATGTPGLNSVHQITDADTLNAPLIDHVQPENTSAARLPRVSTGVCSVCGKSFKLTNLGFLFDHGLRDLRCSGSGSPPQSTDLFMAGTSRIITDSISISDIVRILPRNAPKRTPNDARYQVAKAFTGLLNDCLQKNCAPSWKRLFAFPRLVLCTSDDSGDF
ncbi:hypothetical protein ACOME3_003087 [Neoechinorhynchus agilis]